MVSYLAVLAAHAQTAEYDDAAGIAVPAAENETPSLPDTPLTRLEARIELERQMAAEDYDSAVSAGETLVELTNAEFGDDSAEAAEALQQLAEAQRRAGRHLEAETSYLAAIDIVRALDGPFAEALISPTTGLGDNYYDDGQYVNAVAAYDEARSVQRRVYGLLSEKQVELLDKITASYQQMGLYTEANDQQLSALKLAERNNPPASMEVLEAIYRYSAWLRSVGRFIDERQQYERAIRIIREEYGKDSPLLVRPYREIANSFRASGFEQNQGSSRLQAALELVEQHDPVDHLALAQVLLDMGDWKTAFSTVNGGGAEYVMAWEALGSLDNGDDVREAWFGGRRPVFVLMRRMSDRGLSQDPEAPRGKVIVRFDVDGRGRPENAAVVESEPPGLKDEAALRAVTQSRFRPKMLDGAIIPAQNLGVEINYRYTPPEEETDDPQ
jgi:TonB family protein